MQHTSCGAYELRRQRVTSVSGVDANSWSYSRARKCLDSVPNRSRELTSGIRNKRFGAVLGMKGRPVAGGSLVGKCRVGHWASGMELQGQSGLRARLKSGGAGDWGSQIPMTTSDD